MKIRSPIVELSPRESNYLRWRRRETRNLCSCVGSALVKILSNYKRKFGHQLEKILSPIGEFYVVASPEVHLQLTASSATGLLHCPAEAPVAVHQVKRSTL